jgi:hypothetical protein
MMTYTPTRSIGTPDFDVETFLTPEGRVQITLKPTASLAMQVQSLPNYIIIDALQKFKLHFKLIRM